VGSGVKVSGNQYPSYRTESRVSKLSPLICSREMHFGECLWLGVLRRISSVFGTEKEIPGQDALDWSFSKRSWRRRMLPRYERDATLMARLST